MNETILNLVNPLSNKQCKSVLHQVNELIAAVSLTIEVQNCIDDFNKMSIDYIFASKNRFKSFMNLDFR